MQYNEEFDERDDVLKYQAKGVSFYFVPNENDKYEFCTKEESDEDCRVSLWMSRVKRKEVTLNSIPFVIRDGLIKGAKKEVTKEEFEEIREDVREFCNSITDDYEDDDCENVYVIDKAGGYRDVDFSSYEGVIVNGEIEEKIIFGDEFFKDHSNHTLSGVLDLRGAKEVDLQRCDLSKVTKIIFGEGANVNLRDAKNLPTNLDVSMCEYVDLIRCNLEGIDLEFREGATVNLSFCDLDGIDLEFREGAKVKLWHAKNLPTNLDLSMCDEMDLKWCDLDDVDELKFREGAKVDLYKATNLPKNLDVSMCDWVNLSLCDLDGIDLEFREGATVSLHGATNLPKNLDVSMCDKVNLNKCNLEGINLKFREGAEVSLWRATNFPKDLDVSMCDRVNLSGCDLREIKLRFKNERQLINSLGLNLTYTDDENKTATPVISKRNDGR